MPPITYRRSVESRHPLDALQQRARRVGLRVLRAREFQDYAHRDEDVLVFSASGRRLTPAITLPAANDYLTSFAWLRDDDASDDGGGQS